MKKLLALALTLTLIMPLAACGGSGGASSGEAAPTTEQSSSESAAPAEDGAADKSAAESGELTIWWNTDSEVGRAYLDTFKEIYPGVNLVFYPSEDLKTQTRLAVDSGAAPDIYQTNAGSIFQDFAGMGALMDLTDIVNEYKLLERINPDYIKPYTIDGKYYGFPTAALTTWMSLYVNRDILAQAGVAEDPKTVDDLIAVAAQLNGAGFSPVAFGDKDGWPAILLLGDYFAQQVTDLSLVNRLNAGEITFAECGEFVNAFNTLVQLGQQNVFMSGWKSSDHTAAIQTFAAGQTAFLYNGSWWSSSVDDVENIGFELDVIWLPLMNGVSEISSVQMSSDMCFVASAASTNLDGITKFLEFVTREETSIMGAETSNSFSVYPGANEKIKRAAVFNQPEILEQFNKPALGPFFDWVFPTPVTEQLKVKIVECIDGTTTVDQALTELQAEMDKNLNVMPPVAV